MLENNVLRLPAFYFSMQSDITLYEFNSLTKNEKVEVLCECAIYLCERPDAVFRVVLYQINNFYIEVKYDTINNCIIEFLLFTNTKLLEPYLKQIDISNILAA